MGSSFFRAAARFQLPLALLLVAFAASDAVFALGVPSFAPVLALALAGVLGVPRPSELSGELQDALRQTLAERDELGAGTNPAWSEQQIAAAVKSASSA